MKHIQNKNTRHIEIQNTEEKKNNPFILIIGGVLLVGIILFFIVSFFSEKTTDSKITTPQKENALLVSNAEKIQEVKLSWGKFNYEPEVITVKKGIPVHLIGDLNRLKGCFSSLIIKDLGVEESFTPADNIIEFTPEKEGTFAFGCSMGMGKGTLIVQ